MASKVKLLRYSLVGPFTVLISGLATSGMPRTRWVEALTIMGEALQDEIADSFSSERVAGSSQLLRNDPDYTARKAKQGYDTRRGHRTNTLQSMLRSSVSTLFVIQGPFKNGNARIIFRESLLHSLVPYAEYYEEKKVRRAGILELAKSWLARTKQPVDIAQRLALKALEAAEAVAVRKAAVFAGPRYIRVRGLTQRDVAGISRQATAGLTRSQLQRIARLAR